MLFLELPELMIQQVLEYLSYDEVAKSRIICKKVDKICQRILNHGFFKVTKKHSDNLKSIKLKLPRRESERRNHPLARVSDILTCIETRLSMLSMTYLKYIELDLCCFIPGKVIDEVFSILRLIETTTASKQLRAHEVLQELRDISSMAIEHFDEKIATNIKKSLYTIKNPHLQIPNSLIPTDYIVDIQQPSTSNAASHLLNMSTHKTPMETPATSNKSTSNSCKKNLLTLDKKYSQILNKQSKLIKKQSKQIAKLAMNLKYMKRRLDESETKYRELSANISHLKFDPNGNGKDVVAPAGPASTTRTRNVALNLKRRLNQK